MVRRMTLDEFKATLSAPTPPAGVDPILTGLWHDARGEWAAAHEVAQGREGTPAYDRLHAYLHRKEGDAGNAAYWYRRAKVPVFSGSLESEWAEIAGTHLA